MRLNRNEGTNERTAAAPAASPPRVARVGNVVGNETTRSRRRYVDNNNDMNITVAGRIRHRHYRDNHPRYIKYSCRGHRRRAYNITDEQTKRVTERRFRCRLLKRTCFETDSPIESVRQKK